MNSCSTGRKVAGQGARVNQLTADAVTRHSVMIARRHLSAFLARRSAPVFSTQRLATTAQCCALFCSALLDRCSALVINTQHSVINAQHSVVINARRSAIIPWPAVRTWQWSSTCRPDVNAPHLRTAPACTPPGQRRPAAAGMAISSHRRRAAAYHHHNHSASITFSSLIICC